MKPWIRLTLLPMFLLGVPAWSAAADRDVGGGRDTRMESDELRADIRQERLKKVQELDNPAQEQKAKQSPKAETGDKAETGEPMK